MFCGRTQAPLAACRYREGEGEPRAKHRTGVHAPFTAGGAGCIIHSHKKERPAGVTTRGPTIGVFDRSPIYRRRGERKPPRTALTQLE